MKTVFQTCEPRDEILSGELTDELFAARLHDVIEETAVPIYLDPHTFFENTYPTEGLKTLLREVLGRLSGSKPEGGPFIRLETAFGGGKTHNLIALYHLSQGHGEGLPENLIDTSWVPESPWLVAGIVGSDMDPANGIDHDDINTRTLWGEIAYQIGRIQGDPGSAYESFRASDEQMVAPGTQALEKLVGDGPALILLDEMARYLRAAKAVQTPNKKSDLAEQTVAFLMTLVEYASSKPKISVVLTLADEKDAFGEETTELRAQLEEARRVSARQERVITSAGETEIAKIVTHRMFKSIDEGAAKKTAEEYLAYFKKIEEQETELPPKALTSEYAAEIELSYPFHPELINTLNRKTATIPNFQKTRGALRLLARVVRRLWEEQPEDTFLIGIHHLDLGVDNIANDLTSRLERPVFRSVIEADIVSPQKGSVAHAQTIDSTWHTAGKPSYARRLATNIFLHSLTQGIATGVDPAELMLAVLQPEDDPELIRRTLRIMLAEEKGEPGSAFWFLHWDGLRYRFKTEPSLEKVIQDEMPLVGKVKSRTVLDERIQKVWKKGTFKPIFFPAEAADIDDDAREPKLAIIHYDAATTTASAKKPPELVSKLFNHAGTMEGYRTYKNNLLFLVVDEKQVDRMVDLMQRSLAIERIVGDSDRLGEFNEEQRKRLKEIRDAAELDVRVAITRAYRYLYYPSGDAPKAGDGLGCETIPPQDQGEVSADQSAVILRILRQLEKVLTADDAPMSAAYVKAKAWGHGQELVSTEELRREFCRRIGLKILLDVNQLKRTIKDGCRQGTWIYFDAEEQSGYGKTSPAPLIQFTEDALLYTNEEAQRVKLRIKGEKEPGAEDEPCPVCGNLPCTCGDEGKTERPPMPEFHVEGAPAQAFQMIVDEMSDRGFSSIESLTIRCEGMGQEAIADARALGLAIPQLGKGTFRIEQKLNASFDTEVEQEQYSSLFSGGWARYKRLKTVTDAFGQEATEATITIALKAVFDRGLSPDSDHFQSIRDVFDSLGMGRILVDVVAQPPAEEDSA